MRGWDARSEVLFSYVNCEARVPKDHPLRAIVRIVDESLAALSPEFDGLYAKLCYRPVLWGDPNSSSIALASFRSAVSSPSLNQP